MANRKVNDNQRLNLYVHPDIVAKIDAFALRLGLSRSSAIAVICNEYFRTEEATSAMGKMNSLNLFEIIASRMGSEQESQPQDAQLSEE